MNANVRWFPAAGGQGRHPDGQEDRARLLWERLPREVSSAPVFVKSTRAQRKLPQTKITLVIARPYLVQIGRIDGPRRSRQEDRARLV